MVFDPLHPIPIPIKSQVLIVNKCDLASDNELQSTLHVLQALIGTAEICQRLDWNMRLLRCILMYSSRNVDVYRNGSNGIWLLYNGIQIRTLHRSSLYIVSINVCIWVFEPWDRTAWTRKVWFQVATDYHRLMVLKCVIWSNNKLCCLHPCKQNQMIHDDWHAF